MQAANRLKELAPEYTNKVNNLIAKLHITQN